jgi:hypothetical protein
MGTNVGSHTLSSNMESSKRTRDEAGRNEAKDIESIVSAIHNRTPNGLKIIKSFQDRFGVELLDAKCRSGNRQVHFDFQILVGPAPGVWKTVEHKGSRDAFPISESQKPWSAGVQFYNGGCEKYSIGKKYAKLWYDIYIVSGSLKEEWNLTAEIPTFEEWYMKDVKCQGDPKTAFGKELKAAVRKVRGPTASLREKRAAVNEAFTFTEEELALFKTEVLKLVNEVLLAKEYWLTIHGDPEGEMYCAWYPQFSIGEIQEVTIRKELDIWIDFTCSECSFTSIIRWGKGAGFSNLRIDLR